MLWDHLAAMLRSARCPRARGTFDRFRRPWSSSAHFWKLRLLMAATTWPCSGQSTPSGSPLPSVTGLGTACRLWASALQAGSRPGPRRSPAGSCLTTFARSLPSAFGSEASDEIGLRRDFIRALPPVGNDSKRSRSPFSDDVARALAPRRTCAGSPRSMTRSTTACEMPGRPSSIPAAGAARSSPCTWTASAAIRAWPCRGTTRPRKALAALGLLDQTLALDFRRPQDHVDRIWSTGFRADQLAGTADSELSDQPELAGEPAWA